MLMTRRCYQSSPGDRRRHRRSRLAWRWRRSERNFMRAALPPANFKSTENERGRRGVLLWRQEWRDAEREEGGRRGVFVRDTARTSPRSHMVVEKVLYGCVCLSVQFRIFTGKRCRPAVCNNRSPSLPSCFTTVSLSLSLCFCLFVSAAITENLLAVVTVTDGRRWLAVGTSTLSFY